MWSFPGKVSSNLSSQKHKIKLLYVGRTYRLYSSEQLSSWCYKVKPNETSGVKFIGLHQLINEDKKNNFKLDIYHLKKIIQVFSIPTSLLIPKCMGNFNKNLISPIPGFFIGLQGYSLN